MNWFSGRLEVKWVTGRIQVIQDLSFKQANEYLEDCAQRVVSAMYFPHPISLYHDEFHKEEI